jgi:hypothetical protein
VSNKKKKRRRRPVPAAAPEAAPIEQKPEPARAARERGDGARRAAPNRPAISLVQPPLLPSLGRGFLAVGRSPGVVISAFVGLLALWLMYSTTGVVHAITPGTIGQLLAIPPLHSALSDGNLLNVAVRVFPPASTLVLMAAIVVLRAAMTSYWLATVLAKLAPPPDDAEDVGPRSRAIWAFRSILGLEALFLAVMVGLPIVLSQFLGIIGLLGAVLGATYFLVYAPAVAVVEGAGVRESVRLAARAARARGMQHTLLVFSYIMGVLLLLSYAFSGRDAPVTPSVLVWAVALAMTFVHLSVLATFVDRWLTLRKDVKAYVAARSQQPRSRAGAGAR